jgi:hypothetical protein
MSYTYTFANAEETSLKREDGQGNIAFVPNDPRNRDYAEFLSSGATAAAYVAPEPIPLPKLTAEEKLARSGLTVDELKELLGL